MTADDKKPNRLAKGGAESQVAVIAPVVAKVAGELSGIPYVGPLVGALADLVTAHIARTRDAMRQQTEQRLADFYEEVFRANESMDEQVAAAMVDDQDFHALLRACAADIEAEKVRAYANLARGIASGAVTKQWRRHFILCLRDLSADELECLRGALIALKHELIPSQGPSMGQEHFLRAGRPGTPQAIWVNNLVARGLIHEEKLSQAGEAFAQACYQAKDLTPASIGYRAWSGHNVAIISYELGATAVVGLSTNLQDSFRVAGAKSSILAVLRDNEQQARRLFTMGVVLVRERSKVLEENLPHLTSFARRVPTMLVDVFGQAGEIVDVPFFERVNGSGIDQASLVAEVRRHVVAKSNELGALNRRS